MSWFDRPDNSPTELAALFNEQVPKLTGLTTESIAIKMEAFSVMIIGFSVSALLDWKITLIAIGVTPFIFIGGIISNVFEYYVVSKRQHRDPYYESNEILRDLIHNYRLIQSFGHSNVEMMIEKFTDKLKEPASSIICNAHVHGLAFGFSVGARFFYAGAIFYIGALLSISYEEVAAAGSGGSTNSKSRQQVYQNIFQAVFIIFSSYKGAGLAFSSVPSQSEARAAA